MTPYATAEDVKKRWIATSLPPRDDILNAYLEEATIIIDSELPEIRVKSVDDSGLRDRLRLVTTRMVIRATQNPDRIRQIQETTGPYSAGLTVDSATLGDMRLTADDRAILLGGASRQGKAFTIDTTPSRVGFHGEVCSLRFGAAYCSCGSDINGDVGPIFKDGT